MRCRLYFSRIAVRCGAVIRWTVVSYGAGKRAPWQLKNLCTVGLNRSHTVRKTYGSGLPYVKEMMYVILRGRTYIQASSSTYTHVTPGTYLIIFTSLLPALHQTNRGMKIVTFDTAVDICHNEARPRERSERGRFLPIRQTSLFIMRQDRESEATEAVFCL